MTRTLLILLLLFPIPALAQELKVTRIEQLTGWHLVVSGPDLTKGGIVLELDQDPDLGEEGYELSISPDYIRLCANQPAGLFYAIQTLLQLLPAQHHGTFDLPTARSRSPAPRAGPWPKRSART